MKWPAQDHTASIRGRARRWIKRLLTVHLLHFVLAILSLNSRRSALEVFMWDSVNERKIINITPGPDSVWICREWPSVSLSISESVPKGIGWAKEELHQGFGFINMSFPDISKDSESPTFRSCQGIFLRSLYEIPLVLGRGYISSYDHIYSRNTY